MKSIRFCCLALVLLWPGLALGEDFDSAGVKIHYLVRGEGPPVVLIHGLLASAKLNWEWPGVIAQLTNHHQVIALDCRGHGQSDKPTADGQYGMKMVEDVVRLMDHLKIKQADIAGYSMGGMIAMKLMATHPERVRSAVVAGMGWAQEPFWKRGGPGGTNENAFVACLRGFAELTLTEKEVRGITNRFIVVIGERDPLRRETVEPLRRIRPDVPVKVIEGANHLSCVRNPQFKTELRNFLDSGKN